MKSFTFDNVTILIGCFLINFLICGTGRLSSIYFVESITRYDVDREQASFPFVLAFFVRNISGPLIGYLEQIFGMKRLIVSGCVISTFSIGACYFAEDILTITILWGIIFGICFGFGCQMLPALVNSHFPLNKSKANSVYYTGSSIGNVILPFIAKFSIEHYGVSGSYLIVSAILAHSIPAALILKNPRITDSKETLKQNKSHTINMGGINKTEQSKVDASNNLPNLETNTITNNKPVTIATSVVCNKSYNGTNMIGLERIEQAKSKNIKKKLTLRNFAIFIDPVYLVLFVIHALSTLLITCVWTIILDFVRDKGVQEMYEIYFIISIPISEVVGRFGAGYFIDKKFLSTLTYTFITFLFCASCSVLIVFAKSYALLIIIECLLSIFMGAIALEQVDLIHEYIEPEKRVMAMTCRFMLYAPLSLTIPLMIGYFRGNGGSYDNVFYLLGITSLFCGILVCILPHITKKKN